MHIFYSLRIEIHLSLRPVAADHNIISSPRKLSCRCDNCLQAWPTIQPCLPAPDVFISDQLHIAQPAQRTQ